ncbi:xylose isomerase [Burkholderia sp. SG-MS1]|uniref:sugar phosphate isomerase/epimerase family protein n=1 Tax=Paraburkholderia sp. SG-MS1 TaxID=2023741 RepID=UPI001447AAED|nr:sugar phosphate isomerase/epimerase [Paraburkholderia sp. SG-MS1]NKJ47675.1 xylose isomerase [Paraburkholderia sp. SG-MS1]
MSTPDIDLLAAYWTLAGDVDPLQPSISPYSLQARVEAASKAGWRGIGVIHEDLVATIEKVGANTVKHILEDNGIKHFELEFLVDWYRDGPERLVSDRARRVILELGAKLGMKNVKIAASALDQRTPNFARMADEFATLCQEAAAVGSNVSIEVMPFSIVKTLEDGLAIVQEANQPNGGLLLDIWHMVRGGIDFSEIAKVPSQFIKAVELDDAGSAIEGTLLEDTVFRRKLCGEGQFDCPGFIEAVQNAGFSGQWYGVEIISTEYRKLPLQEMAIRSFNTTMQQFRNVETRQYKVSA